MYYFESKFTHYILHLGQDDEIQEFKKQREGFSKQKFQVFIRLNSIDVAYM